VLKGMHSYGCLAVLQHESEYHTIENGRLLHENGVTGMRYHDQLCTGNVASDDLSIFARLDGVQFADQHQGRSADAGESAGEIDL
jgi:hypothetical protein